MVVDPRDSSKLHPCGDGSGCRNNGDQDRWEFYSDAEALGEYIALRDSGGSRNTLIEEEVFLSLVGDVRNLCCLDLGCGFGYYSNSLARAGATVTGIDRSELMITEARKRMGSDGVEYLLRDMEKVEFPADSYDLVISNLAFHYVRDIAPLFQSVRRWLRHGGRFVFTVEHPVYTACHEQDTWCDEEPHRRWMFGDYFDEDLRWGFFGRKYHHTFETWCNTVLESGFGISRVCEPQPSRETMGTHPELAEDLHRPLFLLMSCRKEGAIL